MAQWVLFDRRGVWPATAGLPQTAEILITLPVVGSLPSGSFRSGRWLATEAVGQYATSGQRFDSGPMVSVIGRSPTAPLLSVETGVQLVPGLASYSAGAPAGRTAGGSSHADTIHAVHTCAANFADFNDHFVRLVEEYGWQSLCR